MDISTFTKRSDGTVEFGCLAAAADELLFAEEVHLDGSLRILYASAALGRLLGRDASSEEPATAWEAAIEPADLAIRRDSLDALRDGRATSVEYRLRRADGERRWVWEPSWPRRRPRGASSATGSSRTSPRSARRSSC